jgi:hypothetical protein
MFHRCGIPALASVDTAVRRLAPRGSGQTRNEIPGAAVSATGVAVRYVPPGPDLEIGALSAARMTLVGNLSHEE